MRSFDEALDHAREGTAFSNGFEYDHWYAQWCDRCAHEKPMRDDGQPNEEGILGCVLLAVSFLHGVTPSEWMEQDRGRLGDQYHCIEFRNEDDGPAGPTGPIPDPPGQGLLLPREPFEGVRMLTTYPTSRDVVSVSLAARRNGR